MPTTRRQQQWGEGVPGVKVTALTKAVLVRFYLYLWLYSPHLQQKFNKFSVSNGSGGVQGCGEGVPHCVDIRPGLYEALGYLKEETQKICCQGGGVKVMLQLPSSPMQELTMVVFPWPDLVVSVVDSVVQAGLSLIVLVPHKLLHHASTSKLRR
ncbi:hypothetical protein E2C01_010338 [Portunus trituberculatus]|uniref:Uncharacterized protein n=1 Tax=Portunus trituberculatus TaxID=210409 RepID=A0A5B7D834_PORTR|nr:hypothetical protein [Portunus trituberculatus]